MTDGEAWLRGLTPSQREAVATDAAPLCVVAGAGSGKTRVLTRRVARRVADGSAKAPRTVVLTFTRKAASELRQRLAALGTAPGVTAGTFHAVAYAQLRRHWAGRGLRPPGLLDAPERLLTRLGPTGADPAEAASVAAEISWARARRVDPARYADAARAAGRRPSSGLGGVADRYAAYEEAKRRRGVVDLHDLLDTCADLLERDCAFAEAQRWLYRHFYVDEFQDLNQAQWRLLTAWVGGRDDLCVVGDPDQAVYGFNGADPTLLARLPDLLPGVHVVRLGDNHRSSPQVLACARAALGGGAAVPARATGRDGPVPTVLAHPDDTAEATAVAWWARSLQGAGRGWSQLAVLARTNARLAPAAAALRAAGIPYRLRRAAGEAAAALPAELAGLRADQPLRAALSELAASDPALARRLGDVADELLVEDPAATVGEFRAWWRNTVEDPAPLVGPSGSGAVDLMTFHAAKGLEWPAVALVGLEAGTVPTVHARGPAALAEERRLLYVACTRAGEILRCSFARSRQVGGRTRECEPSPFLADLAAACVDAAPAPAGSASAHIAALRSSLSRLEPAGQP